MVSNKGARVATQAIERMYITMRYLLNRGGYRPMGLSGTTLREGLLELKPEIYGAIAEDKLELEGLLYVLDRLPEGIEECAVINLTGEEGYKHTSIPAIVPPKRRRNCFRIDKDHMNIEITRGRSDIYDVLTHLTFLYIESYKIANRVTKNESGALQKEWNAIEDFLLKGKESSVKLEVALIHCANIVGRTYEELKRVYDVLGEQENPHRLLKTIYWLGKLAIKEVVEEDFRIVTFSAVLRERLGQHIHGELWAKNVKQQLSDLNLLDRNVHIISANMHSVMNYLYAKQALKDTEAYDSPFLLFEALSELSSEHKHVKEIVKFAQKNGMTYYKDSSGSNIDVQIFDLSKVSVSKSLLNEEASFEGVSSNDVLLVMDYAFGEQAFELMDELLKPFKIEGVEKCLNVASISIMGKAGILPGQKGDIIIPCAHVFEGTSDNYPFKNELTVDLFKGNGLNVYSGNMITVLGTSLQNREMLKYFKYSTWDIKGLEMEGAHYQKAIQAATMIRKSISDKVKLRYAYYASDNPLETGSTLASGPLGRVGVKPTYLITREILRQILG